MARQSTSELLERLREVVQEYGNRVSNAEAVGALEFIKAEIVDRASDGDDEDD